ncbi:glycosyltransferase [Marivita sp. S6314]|uniref:glycosyltransferase n=1 Tax=Marivita sp. S6314 TaxID=2926406 RepID=UPI001FF2E4C9|nr:glycosyltransferase [Marivita sp. S6314]MCK0148646.1 glycosyltransferase [Marivita sp. S6314]
MTASSPATIVCMLPRLGTSVGGGKINAIFRRMNLFATRDATRVVLLTLEHSVACKIAFAQLQADGVLDQRITHHSLFEFCLPAGGDVADGAEASVPEWDQQMAKGGKKQRISYYRGDDMVMRDTLEDTAAGVLTIRQIFSDADRDVRLKYLNDDLIEGVARFGDGMVHKSFYVEGAAVCEMRMEHRAFRFADSAVTGQRYFNEHTLQKNLVAQAFPEECLVFVDGITSVYLAQHITARKVLFLHANHRAPDGRVLRRSRYMIEHFQGDRIVTATQAHKARLEMDMAPACRVDVIPHYADMPPPNVQPRRHICTVSRLRLADKPIHQCIEAFTRIMHLIPECNYLIYGTGPDQARLEQLIHHHDCADRVFLMGHTPEPGDVFAASCLSLAPTLSEGFGLSLLESMTHACPVVSFDVDYGPRELIDPGKTGELVTPGDIDGIAQAILRVYRNQPAYSAASAQRAARYSFDAYRTAYFKLVDDVMQRQTFFDISARDLRSEVTAALDTAPKSHKARLLDLYIKLSTDKRDLEATYWGFQMKRRLLPEEPRPLMRCIWLSRRLGRTAQCHQHLAEFEQAFPQHYRSFIDQHPEFLALVDMG